MKKRSIVKLVHKSKGQADKVLNRLRGLKLLLALNEKMKNVKKILHKNNKYDTIIAVIEPYGGF